MVGLLFYLFSFIILLIMSYTGFTCFYLRVGIDLPKIDIRFDHLSAEAEPNVGSTTQRLDHSVFLQI